MTGEWYIRLEGDYLGLVRAYIRDYSNPDVVADVELSPPLTKCSSYLASEDTDQKTRKLQSATLPTRQFRTEGARASLSNSSPFLGPAFTFCLNALSTFTHFPN